MLAWHADPMAKSGGSLGRGRRLAHEVPAPRDPADLSDVAYRAQLELRALVEEVGGPAGTRQVPVAHLDLLGELFDEWAQRHGDRTSDGWMFSGHPGLWHALDELWPLQDPNRWDALRKAVIERLEASHWTRLSPPRGSAFHVRLRET